jgi:glycosyltransferase involved in cell wall biosynthesis
MRVGQNPAKSIDHVHQPARLTLAVVVYIPFLHGYYQQSLQVLKACLGSLWQNTPQPYDLLVFDNASCEEVRNFLRDGQQDGRIQYLVLSDRNVGKGGAWNLIFQGAPGEILAYSDSDVYFYPGWLEESLKILEGFPHVGMVTARPLRTPETYYSSTLAWAQETPNVIAEQGQFMPWEIYQEHTDSLGISVEQAREWYLGTTDRRVQYQGLSAYIGAAHFQFIAYKQILQSMAPIKMDRPMGQVRTLDEMLNNQGYLRLATPKRLVRHLGNRLDATSLPPEVDYGEGVPPLPQGEGRGEGKKRQRKHLKNIPLIRRGLFWLYDRIFRLYYSNDGH